MLEDIIEKGALEMSSVPVFSTAETARWSGLLSVRITVVVAVLAVLFILSDLIFLTPFILNCLGRSKGNVSLEHSLSTARVRNGVALVMMLPFCIIADRFRLLSPAFLDVVPAEVRIFCVFGLFLAYLLVRLLCFGLLSPAHFSSEESSTLRNSIKNYFIPLTVLMIVTATILAVLRCPDAAVRTVLIWEIGAFYLLYIVRIAQFLGFRCNIFMTFLYLCALEFLPAGLLVASGFFF